MTYTINKTDVLKPAIGVEETEIKTNRDIVLFGRRRLQYGEQMNENLLHILENYACPEDEFDPGNPDLSQTSDISETRELLSRPVDGQMWYNSTTNVLYYRDDSNTWRPIPQFGDISANWGVLAHGQQIPLPESTGGHTYTYDECSWMVSPLTYPEGIDFMECSTDTDANVTMQYSTLGSSALADGLATYLIVGIKGNINLGDNTKPILSSPPIPSPTPTPSVTSTPAVSVSATPGVSTTPAASNTPAPSVTPTSTPAPGVSSTPAPSSTPAVSSTPSPSSTPAVTSTPAPSVTPSASQTAPLAIATTDYVANPGANISGISSICDVADYVGGGDSGITNCGANTFGGCGIGECAPETGGQSLGPQMRVTVTGGTAPYTVVVKNVTGNGSLPVGHCMDMGFPSPVLITNATSLATVISTFVIATDGGFQNCGSFNVSCDDVLFFANGNFVIEVTDDDSTVQTLSQSWSTARIDTANPE